MDTNTKARLASISKKIREQVLLSEKAKNAQEPGQDFFFTEEDVLKLNPIPLPT